MIVAYATIGDMDPIAGVFMDIQDEDGLRQFAEQATDFGFIGMSAVAPGQVDTINDVFTPPEDQVAEARELVEKYDASESDVLVVDGQLLEEPIVERYRTMIAQYDAIVDE
jgi:citrate lyase beta subunit